MFLFDVVNKQKAHLFSANTFSSVTILGWKSLVKATGREIFPWVGSTSLQTLDFHVIQERNTAGRTLDDVVSWHR